MQEQFKDIPGYEGYYMISNKGTVKSVARTITRRDGYTQRLGEKNIYSIKQGFPSAYYYAVPLSKNSKMELLDIARTVLQVFTDDFDIASMYVKHKDGDPANCALNNLQYQYYMSRAGGTVTVKHKRNKKHYINIKQAADSLKFDHKSVIDQYSKGKLVPSKGLTITFELPFTYNNKTITEIKL